MLGYDFSYPAETSVNYFYDEYDVRGHVNLILGGMKKDLFDKLIDFKKREVFSNDFIDYDSFLKREGDFSEFFVKRRFGQGYINSEETKYSDSPYTYLLGCNDKLGAILGFEPRPRAILVTQIQGFFEEKKIWGDLRYPDLLLDLCYRDLKGIGIPEMWVLPYFRNQWKDVRENFQDTKKRQYDIPAKRQGFIFDSAKGVWVKNF